MDDAIFALVKNRGDKNRLKIDYENESIELLDDHDDPTESLKLKPLAQLYGPGTGLSSVEFNDNRFLSLLLAIEENLADNFVEHPSMTDADVLLALDRLAMSPEANIANEPLARQLQISLRVTLSLNDFSRQDVRMCLKKVKQSATRHNKTSGPRGYLNFIRQSLRK